MRDAHDAAIVRQDAVKNEGPLGDSCSTWASTSARAEKSCGDRRKLRLTNCYRIWRIVGHPSTTSTRSALDVFAASHELGHNTTRVGASSALVSSAS